MSALPNANANLQLFNSEEFAALTGSARQTIYNLVSTGKLSRPIKTLAGPRFTIQHYQEFIGQACRPDPEPEPPAPRGRGRPRIVQQPRRAGGAA